MPGVTRTPRAARKALERACDAGRDIDKVVVSTSPSSSRQAQSPAMTTDHAHLRSEREKRREPRLVSQMAGVLAPPALVMAIPAIWLWMIDERIRPETVAPWMSAALSLMAVLWAITRARVDSVRRNDDLRNAEERRRADVQAYQQRIDEERWHQRAMLAATVIGVIRQTHLPKPGTTKFFVNVEIRNAGQQPILEVSIDALWLLREPIATSEQYVLHPDDPAWMPQHRQVQILEPGQKLSTKSATWAGGELTSDPPFGWTYASHQSISGYSINPVGDIVPAFSFMDNTGQRWQRVGSDIPTPLPFDFPPAPSPPEGAVGIWPAESTLTITSR